MKLKINNPELVKLHGNFVDVQCNQWGKPLQRYWRNRLHDAKIDNCVEVVDAQGKAKKRNK